MEKSVTERVERAADACRRRGASGIADDARGERDQGLLSAGVESWNGDERRRQSGNGDMFHLPPGIEFPFTLRSEPANLPVVLAAISGKGLSEKELYTIGYYAVRNKMGGLKGVQIPHPFGGKFRQMMIYVDPGSCSRSA
jgi:hydrophobic/amphiphilic exporter-1 (mainly G- bacteria), HAE1 family